MKIGIKDYIKKLLANKANIKYNESINEIFFNYMMVSANGDPNMLYLKIVDIRPLYYIHQITVLNKKSKMKHILDGFKEYERQQNVNQILWYA